MNEEQNLTKEQVEVLLKKVAHYENKVKKDINQFINGVLYWIGLIAAIISSLAYAVLTFILIFGVKVNAEVINTRIAFMIIGVFIGLVITTSLKIQGDIIASNEEHNKKVMNEYKETMLITEYKTDKKPQSMKQFYIKSTISDILVKGVSVIASLGGMIYFAVSGSNDYALIGLMLVNILLFSGFGILSLRKAYNHYNNEHIQFIKMKIQEAKLVQELAKKEIKVEAVKPVEKVEEPIVRERESILLGTCVQLDELYD